MKEIFIDINGRISNFIDATENDNNSDIYKIVLTENDRRIDLTNKTVNMAYVLNGTKEGDVMNLNITFPAEGEITLVITEILTKREGNYTCQIVILGEDNYRKHTNYFNLSIRENLFNKISGEIIESPNLGILQELIKKAEFLNTQLENNNNVAESLNTNLAENIKLADPLNTSLIEKIPEAATKKSELETSITKAKEFIDGLDGSQDIPGIRMELTELQNGLKSNQALEYEGSSISATDTLEGRTENLKIKGLTLFNYARTNNPVLISTGYRIPIDYLGLENGETYSFYVTYLPKGATWSVNNPSIDTSFTEDKLKVRTLSKEFDNNFKAISIKCSNITLEEAKKTKLIVLKGDWRNKDIPSYFEGIKSFGEAEKEEDKYKIKLLSKNKNLFNKETDLSNWWGSHGELHKGDNSGKKYSILTKAFSGLKYIINVNTPYSFYTFLDDNFNVLCYGEDKNTQVAPVGTTKILWYLDPGGIDKGLYNKIQVEPGTISTEYQAYQEDKKDILISAPLRSVEDVQDIIFEEEGKVKITRNIDTYTFNGEEAIRDTTEQDEKSDTGKYKVFALTVNKTIDIDKNINNNFPKKSFSVAFQNMDSEGLAVTQYGIYIKILKSKLSTQDTEGFKAWLKANTTTIYYASANPITEVVNGIVDIDLDTFQDKTYFSILNKIPGTLDFKVPSNLGSVVQSMAKEVNNIWDVINNLLVPGLMDTKKTLALKTIKNNLK